MRKTGTGPMRRSGPSARLAASAVEPPATVGVEAGADWVRSSNLGNHSTSKGERFW